MREIFNTCQTCGGAFFPGVSTAPLFTVNQTCYRVRTWDEEVDDFTPQDPLIPFEVWGLAGLRDALRRLRSCGYEGRRGDPSTLVFRADEDVHEMPEVRR